MWELGLRGAVATLWISNSFPIEGVGGGESLLILWKPEMGFLRNLSSVWWIF